MLAATLTLLSPRGALVGVAALAVVAAALVGSRRADAVRRTLRLPAPSPRRVHVRIALVALVVALLTLSAAQPALTSERVVRTRRDVQVLFVLDVSRSMAASRGARGDTRLDRAAADAHRLRAHIPGVAAGIATLTDRVLPDLLPVPDATGFDAVLARGLAIESPPPQSSGVRATSYTALAQIPGAGYFDPKARTRIVVVLTDGESNTVQTGEVAAAFAANTGYRLLFVRVWRAGEAIYGADGRPEAAYRPDPSGRAVLASLAAVLGGRAYEEGATGAAGDRLRALAGMGPSAAVGSTVQTQRPLAAFSASLALLGLLALAVQSATTRGCVLWPTS